MEKLIRILLFATLFLVMSQPSSAHEPEKNKKNELQETVSGSTVHPYDPARETIAAEHLSENIETYSAIVKAILVGQAAMRLTSGPFWYTCME